MKSLSLLVKEIPEKEIVGSIDRPVSSLILRSDQAKAGSAFFAWLGEKDGHQYINDAIGRGARIIICENLPEYAEAKSKEVTFIKVKSARLALGEMASKWFDDPSEKLKLVGVTGTNGKTTVATLLYQLFQALGYKAGLLSTIENKIHEKTFPTHLTTLDPIALNEHIWKMVEAGCSHCFMEVSSHAADQGRISGLHFSGGIFTNVTHDHLDYHGIFSDYLKAKQSFFDNLHDHAFALANKDDENGEFILQNTKASKYFYGLGKGSDFDIDVKRNDFSGLLLSVNNMACASKLVGVHNAYNLGAIFGAAVLLDEKEKTIAHAIEHLEAPAGRFQVVKGKKDTVGIVDYAHTPNAVENVLHTIRDLAGNRQVVAVIGCGGDRDKKKRPVMARIAKELSDFVVLTSDNPRSEEPFMIIKDMEEGVMPLDRQKIYSIPDRTEAIEAAVKDLAQPGDIIAVLGKGHEKYQIIGREQIPFDDVEELKKAFAGDKD